MAEDAYVTVHRRDDTTQDWVFHGKLPPTDATEERIATMFGGGTFRCQEKYRHAETGRFVIGRTRTVKLSGAYRPPVGDLPGSETLRGAPMLVEASAVPEMAPSRGVQDIIGAGILQLFNSAQSQQAMMMQMFTTAQQNNAALLQSALEQNKGDGIKDLLAAVVPLLTAFLSQPKQDRDPLEMIQAVGAMLKQNTPTPSGNMAETITAMRELMEVRDMLGGGKEGGDADPLVAAVPRLVEVLAEESARRRAAPVPVARGPALPLPPTTLQVAPGSPLPVGLGDRPVPTAPAGDTVPLWLRVLRDQRKRLALAASFGRDPVLTADVALEYAPDAVADSIMELVQREDALTILTHEVPELATFTEWTEQFLARLRENLSEEEPSEPTGPQQMDAGDREVPTDGDQLT